ncbi:MAG: hypothetical protein KC684_02875 [Candidatus Omnitrophica bacterium]|nr:hypothetical protein [Candidatus Omnitrophota bacterium]
MKKRILLILGCAFCFFPNRVLFADVDIQNKPTHYIFLIHGIGGTRKHFGHMEEALTRALNKHDPTTTYLVKSIEYDTGNDEKMPYDFARDINQEIESVISLGNLKTRDEFSLIMHSQGGLVGSIWIFQSLQSTPGFASPELIKHLDAFITLGTPFWGAKVARWGSEVKDITHQWKLDLKVPFGKQELEQMTFGSDMIFDFRISMIDPEYEKYIDYLKHHVRFLNIVGVADVLNPLGVFVSGTQQYEDDGAVPISSGRFNFLYTQSIKNSYEEGDVVTLKNMRSVEMAPHLVVKGVHKSPFPQIKHLGDLPQTPSDCLHNEDCDDPTFPHIWRHILREKLKKDNVPENFRSFLLDVNVRLPETESDQCRDINIEIRQLNGDLLEDAKIKLSKFYEFYSEGMYASQKYPGHCRFYFTGSIESPGRNRKEALLLKFSAPGFKSRDVQVQLRGSYSSFVDINLETNE